jgi:hypothetical protein
MAFAALDELAAIHETLDKQVHHMLHVQETSLTDRLDSVLVSGYGLIGLLTLYVFRQEVYRYRAVWSSFGLGVGLFFSDDPLGWPYGSGGFLFHMGAWL